MADHPTLDQLEAEILNLPPAVTREYQRARESLGSLLSSSDLYKWMAEGRDIAQQSFRAWEATAEYFRVSRDVLGKSVPAEDLQVWSGYGRQLASVSAPISISYFRTSPLVLTRLGLDQLGDWAALGERLYRGTWKSSALSTHFFEASYALLKHLTLQEMDTFATFLETISQKSNDMAEECLNLSESVFGVVATADVTPFLGLLQQTAVHNWKYSKETMQSGALALRRIHAAERAAFLNYATLMVPEGGRAYLVYLVEGSLAMEKMLQETHVEVLRQFDVLWRMSTQAAVEFLKSAPAVRTLVDEEAMRQWYAEGARFLKDNEAAGVSYFKLESGRGDALLQALSSKVLLEDVLGVLRMYSRALTGEDLDIQSNINSTERKLGWVAAEKAATDGRSIYLPTYVDKFRDKDRNFVWYKVITNHQAGHLEFASFDFVFDREGNRFPTWRDQMEQGKEGRKAFVDFQRFFDLFDDRQMASDIFTIVEDARVDHLVTLGYAGLRSVYAEVRLREVDTRPSPEDLPLREALMEVLVRMTLLESPETVRVPVEARPIVERVAAVLRNLRAADATVEDAAEATIRIYNILYQVPNLSNVESEWEDVDVEQLGQDMDTPENTAETPEKAGQADKSGDVANFVPPEGSPEESPYESPEQVDYRGDFKPELTQVVANLRQTQQGDETAAPQAIDEEALKRLAEQSAELDIEVVDGDIEQGAGTFVSQLLNEYLNEREKAEAEKQKKKHSWKPSQEGPLEEEENSFLYPEWDFKANDYKPRWCRVREITADAGTMEFYNRTLEHHAMLVSQIRRQFEMMVPESFSKIRYLPDGEDFELDAVIDAVVQRRAGAPMSEKLYFRRTKAQRDVAVIFLLDMSASTAEAIDEKPAHDNDDWRHIPDDPREYLFWLRQRREAAKKNYKRIIDIERESTVLLIRALETIGDQYGIYGFSGYGRENVEFYTIKDIKETFTDAVPRRIDAIAPLHATRMGPAIRHATAKLKDVSAKTRMLFLISDGRPQDRGYSREGVEKEYAVLDTHKALLEARSAMVTPFCLTVDRSGHDYMKEMCGDIPYEVLEDVTVLPERLPQIYRRLTF